MMSLQHLLWGYEKAMHGRLWPDGFIHVHLCHGYRTQGTPIGKPKLVRPIVKTGKSVSR